MITKTPKAKQERTEAPVKQHTKKCPELIDAIIESIETSSSISTTTACKNNGLSIRQWMKWVETDEEVAQKYARAKMMQAELMAEEIISIADESKIGVKTKVLANGKKETTTGDMVDRARLMVDSRKWLLSKLIPKKYGDKLGLQHTGENGGPIQVTWNFVKSSIKPEDR